MNLSIHAVKRTHSKHAEWHKRLQASVETRNVDMIPDECKWLLYWHQKMIQQDPETFQKVEQPISQLIKDAAILLNEENGKNLEKAFKHRLGTKVRVKHHYSYIYHYTNYIHPLLLETGSITEAHDTINDYMHHHFNEVYEFRNDADNFQTSTVIRFLKAAKSVILNIPDHLLGIFIQINDSKIKPEEPHLAMRFVNMARAYHENNQNSIAGVHLCQALGCCVFLITHNYESENDRNYYRPRTTTPIDFNYWLGLLKSRKKISLDNLIEYSIMYEKWHTQVGTPTYTPPQREELAQKIEEISDFIEEQLNQEQGES
jgi:hypothetical protein